MPEVITPPTSTKPPRKAVRSKPQPPSAPIPRSGKPVLPQAAAAPDDSPRAPKLTSIAYDKLLRAIVEGRLDLGEPLSENDLARALKLSKAPVRESLGELRLRGLVEVVPQSGSYVFSPTPDQIEELCDYRTLLETAALRLSMELDPKCLVADLKRVLLAMKSAGRRDDLNETKRLDSEFHLAILHHSRNRYLIQSYEQIGLTVAALRYRFINTSASRHKAHEEHAGLVQMLEAGEVARAIRLLERHIREAKRMQRVAGWRGGRLKRRDYRFRNYSEILL